MPRALILGATGQDGQFLADFLLGKEYEVLGTSRSKTAYSNNPLSLRRPIFRTVDITSIKELGLVLADFKPDEIYNLAGESSVSRSFQHPTGAIESNVLGVVNLLTTIMQTPGLKDVRIFQASSAEMFGSQNAQLNESSQFRPVSPYAISKLAAHKISDTYRRIHGIWISCGILFNHESEIRPEHFVFQKIITSAVSISTGQAHQLTLGNLEISRDWGYSRDYVEAMWKLLQAETPDDYVVATGKKHSLRDLIGLTFATLGINSEIEPLVNLDPSLSRPTDVQSTWGDPSKIRDKLGWKARTSFEELVELLIQHQLRQNS